MTPFPPNVVVRLAELRALANSGDHVHPDNLTEVLDLVDVLGSNIQRLGVLVRDTLGLADRCQADRTMLLGELVRLAENVPGALTPEVSAALARLKAAL